MENTLPRPRDYRSPDFMKMVDQLHEIITGHEIPDAPEPVLAPNELPPAEPLPDALPRDIVGILEYLDAREGKEDVFRIATETEKEFGEHHQDRQGRWNFWISWTHPSAWSS